MKELYDSIYNILSKESKEKIDNFVLDVQSNLSIHTDFMKRSVILRKMQQRHHLKEKILDTAFSKFNDVSNRNITIEINTNPAISFVFTNSTENAYHETAFSYNIVDNEYLYQYSITKERTSAHVLFYLGFDIKKNDFSNAEDIGGLSNLFDLKEEGVKREISTICNIDFLNTLLKNYSDPDSLFDLMLIESDVDLKNSPLFSGMYKDLVKYNNLFKQNTNIKNKL